MAVAVNKCTLLEESRPQSFFVNTDSDKVVRHLLAYTSVQKWLMGEVDVPFYMKIGLKLTRPFKTSIFNQYFYS